MPKKSAKGGGTIRQRPDGRWEARFTIGRDPGTGRQIQRSVYGATQKEARQKLAQAVLDIYRSRAVRIFHGARRYILED